MNNTNYQQHPTDYNPQPTSYALDDQIPPQHPAVVDAYYIHSPYHPHSQSYDPCTSFAAAVAEPQYALQGSSQYQNDESPIALDPPHYSCAASHSYSYEQPTSYDIDVSPTIVSQSLPLTPEYPHHQLHADVAYTTRYLGDLSLDGTFGHHHAAALQAPRATYPISQQSVFDASAPPSSTYNFPTAGRIQDQLLDGTVQDPVCPSQFSEPIQPYRYHPSNFPSQAHPAPPSLSQAAPSTSNVAQESYQDQMHRVLSHPDRIPRSYIHPVALHGFEVNPAYQEQPGAYHPEVHYHQFQSPSRGTSSLSQWADMTFASVSSPAAAISPSAPLPAQHQYLSQGGYPDVIPAHDQSHQQSAPIVSATQRPLARSSTLPDLGARADSRQSSASGDSSGAASSNGNGGLVHSSTQFEIVPRPVDVVRISSHVRRAARLRVDVGTADINSPTSHKARLLQRRRRGTGTAVAHVGYSPYQRQRDERRGSTSSRAQPPTVPPSPPETPTDRYGAQRTFLFNPYQHPQITSLPDLPASSFPPPLPPVGGGAGSTTSSVTSSGGLSLAQQQTIKFSDEPATTESKGKVVDLRPTEIDPATGEKKPFLACSFCRHRKIACGMRPPRHDDENLPKGPRTCNQCARRGRLCSYPTESRRGLRKTKRLFIVRDGVEVAIEDDDSVDDEPEDGCDIDKRKLKKVRGPMEWIVAIDGWLITPVAWDAYLLTEAGKGAGAPSSESRPWPDGQSPRSPGKDDGDESFTASSSPGAGPSRGG